MWLILRLIWNAISSRSTKNFYDRISPFYELAFTDHIQHVDKILFLLQNLYGQEPPCRVLDLGCGTGLLSRALANQRINVVGLDLSLKSLQKANISTVQGDVQNLPFVSNSFPAVVSLGSWRHFQNPEKVVAEIVRILYKDASSFIVGYFPPKLAGLISLPKNQSGRRIARLYECSVAKLGYYDRIDVDPSKDVMCLLKKNFDVVSQIRSGNYWLLVACKQALKAPKEVNSEIQS